MLVLLALVVDDQSVQIEPQMTSMSYSFVYVECWCVDLCVERGQACICLSFQPGAAVAAHEDSKCTREVETYGSLYLRRY